VTVTGSSELQIYDEPPEAVRDEVIALHNATRRSSHGKERFEWMYLRNPDGPAVVWTLRDMQSGELAGFTAALPRRMLVGGEAATCWIGADFSIRPQYRTLGPAMKLRRAVKNAIDDGSADFLYSHPNQRMAVVHSRVGNVVVGRMVRYAKALRLAPYLRERLGNWAGASLAGALADPVLRVSSREFRHKFRNQIRPIAPARFDERFDRLFEDVAARWPVIGIRDARYLNWRYADNPLHETHALVAEDGDRLRGYSLLTIHDDRGYIKDLFFEDDETVVRDLLIASIQWSRQMMLRNLSLTVLDSNPLLAVATEFGFSLRPDGSEMVAYAPPDSRWHDAVVNNDSWFVTVGDRDV
jgi:hypothetical protein